MPKTEIIEKNYSINNRRYLGSKTKLISFIHDTLKKENITFDSFLDIFGGTGVVAYSFNKNTKVIVNDILECNRVSFNAFLGSEKIDLYKINRLIDSFNEIQPDKDNYFSRNFSNTFFSKNNCKIIGDVRELIEKLSTDGKVNQREKDILLCSLLYSMDKIANTVGHYDAFRRGADLNRKIVFRHLDLEDASINKGNEIYKMDANELAKIIEADVVYIDPPYNSRQYCDAYHLLENVATWKKPKVYGAARKMDRSNIKSKYCENTAPRVFDKLVQDLKCKYIVVSYNNMGLKGAGRSQAKISDVDIVRSLEQRGKVKIYETDFNQFTTGKTRIEDHKERLFICRVGEFDKPKNIKIDSFVKSPLNYTGGKYKLLNQLFERFPNEYKTFVDLFGGGFNVGANARCENVIYNDVSKETTRLIKLFYNYSTGTIVGKLEELINKYNLSDSEKNGYEYYGCNSDNGLGSFNKKGFARLKDDYNNSKQSTEKDLMLLLLTIYSFNNQIRFNSKENYNLPVGKRDFNASTRRNLKLFSEKLKTKKIKFYSADFKEIDCGKLNNPFVYCDPPYLLGDASYNENGGWDDEKEIELLNYLKKVSDKKIKFALSNVIEHKGNKNQLLVNWAIENRFNIIYLDKNYSNSNYQSKAKDNKTIEVLITNY